jgi:hypothetical protein
MDSLPDSTIKRIAALGLRNAFVRPVVRLSLNGKSATYNEA